MPGPNEDLTYDEAVALELEEFYATPVNEWKTPQAPSQCKLEWCNRTAGQDHCGFCSRPHREEHFSKLGAGDLRRDPAEPPSGDPWEEMQRARADYVIGDPVPSSWLGLFG